MIYKANDDVRKSLVPMFENIDSTIVQSYLQGHMGTAYVDDLKNPTVAQVVVGIFVFYAGNPDTEAAEEMLNNLPDYNLVIVGSDDWKRRIESARRNGVEKFPRYSLEKNPAHLDRNHIQSILATLPDGYEVKKVDKEIADKASFDELSEDFVSQFESVDDFLERGKGYAVLFEGKVVSAATSFSIFDEGIEIEIATDPDYRRKGLAAVTASALILDCLDNGLYPSWDAANAESLQLAEKLGYVFKETYDTYFIDTGK
ncbi:GNAT family N-acetyltransferase [Metaplanococcus flavidus]|uniref:GNAT family N-acetyltransferase n=1 Tax=Metaplanococcus flavidus TaxID=569883 RepID=A0ABW3LBY7_9BACL